MEIAGSMKIILRQRPSSAFRSLGLEDVIIAVMVARISCWQKIDKKLAQFDDDVNLAGKQQRSCLWVL
jgi:hypothetical protein